MAAILFKWFIVLSLSVHSLPAHPIFVSVTQIEHNKKEKIMEISCKIFTDDFEKTLRLKNKSKIDLLNDKMHAVMEPLVNAYINQHLKISVDGKPATLKWVGYEQMEEGIMSYLQIDNIPSVKTISVTDNILYEYKSEQISLIHATVDGNRKSTKLNNPEDKTVFTF